MTRLPDLNLKEPLRVDFQPSTFGREIIISMFLRHDVTYHMNITVATSRPFIPDRESEFKCY